MASTCALCTPALLASGVASARRSSSRRLLQALAVRAQAPVHAAGAQAQQDGEGAALQRQQPAQALSPFSALSGLPGFGHMDQMLREMEAEMDALTHAFGLPCFDLATRSGAASPVHSLACDVKDEGDAISITADAPGMAKEDVQVTVTPDNVLLISGERRSEREEGSREGGSWRVERSYGSFRRAFRLPEGVNPEGIQATLSDGVLRLRVPKAAAHEPSAVMVQVQDGTAPEPAQEQEQPGAVPEEGPSCPLPQAAGAAQAAPLDSSHFDE